MRLPARPPRRPDQGHAVSIAESQCTPSRVARSHGTRPWEAQGMLRKTWLMLLAAALALVAPAVASAQGGEAPGAPGASANWTTGNKQGLGTAVGRGSKVWHTLSNGALSEVYYP